MADYNEKEHPPQAEQQKEAGTEPGTSEAGAESTSGGILPEEHAVETFSDVLPVLPVRDVVVFNYMILPLFIGREKSVRAVEAALQKGRHLLICAQREEQTDEPGPDDLYSMGTVVQIMRMLKMPDSRIKVLVQGVSRARITAWNRTEPFIEARIEPVHEVMLESDITVEALLRTAREQSERVLTLRGISSNDVLSVLQSVDDPGRLADLIAANMRMRW